MIETIADAIQANVADWQAKRITFDRFNALACALWDSAHDRGISRDVSAELLRREKALVRQP